MPHLTKDTRLADAIFSDPSIIPTLHRLGIDLGVGEDSIDGACRRRGLDTDFTLTVLNTFLNPDHPAYASPRRVNLITLSEYLLRTDIYYNKVQIPNLIRHFQLLMAGSPDDNDLERIRIFFTDIADDLREAERIDRQAGFGSNTSLFDTAALAAGCRCREAIEDKVNDLARIFVVYLHGSYDSNLCMAVVNAIFMLRRDIAQNNRIRSRLLSPLLGIGNDHPSPSRESLS